MNKRIKFKVNEEVINARSLHEAAKSYAIKKYGRGSTAFANSLNSNNCLWLAFKKDKNENWVSIPESSFSVKELS